MNLFEIVGLLLIGMTFGIMIDIWDYAHCFSGNLFWRAKIMKPEQIRVAIAKDRGWTLNKPIPNYPEDLNAIHEAVATLTDEEYDQYRERLCDLTTRYLDDHKTSYIREVRLFTEATPLQRSIAYCKARGLWVETKEGK